MMNQSAGSAGVLFALIWILVMGGCVTGWVFFLMAAWKMMKAHEALASTMQQIADTLKTITTSPNQNNVP